MRKDNECSLDNEGNLLEDAWQNKRTTLSFYPANIRQTTRQLFARVNRAKLFSYENFAQNIKNIKNIKNTKNIKEKTS